MDLCNCELGLAMNYKEKPILIGGAPAHDARIGVRILPEPVVGLSEVVEDDFGAVVVLVGEHDGRRAVRVRRDPRAVHRQHHQQHRQHQNHHQAQVRACGEREGILM